LLLRDVIDLPSTKYTTVLLSIFCITSNLFSLNRSATVNYKATNTTLITAWGKKIKAIWRKT